MTAHTSNEIYGVHAPFEARRFFRSWVFFDELLQRGRQWVQWLSRTQIVRQRILDYVRWLRNADVRVQRVGKRHARRLCHSRLLYAAPHHTDDARGISCKDRGNRWNHPAA